MSCTRFPNAAVFLVSTLLLELTTGCYSRAPQHQQVGFAPLLTPDTKSQASEGVVTSAEVAAMLRAPSDVKNYEVYISQPIVNTRLVTIPNISFPPGSKVTVESAGGCVNTGGVGHTWKDYKSPQGPNAARLYRGLIWIPGATENGLHVPVGSTPMHLEGVVGHSYIISAAGWNPQDLHLYLGYEDDHYNDNGYYRDKSGATQDQCRPVRDSSGHLQIPRAYVKVRIEQPQTPANVASFKPFDLVSSSVDPNGLLQNPSWSNLGPAKLVAEAGMAKDLQLPLSADDACGGFPAQAGRRTWAFGQCKNACEGSKCECGSNSCSSQSPSFDYPIDLSINKWISCPGNKPLESLNGHANWAPVLYTGTLAWEADQVFDEDANILMYRPVGGQANTFDYSGYTAAYKDEIELEMAGYETWDIYGSKTLKDLWNSRQKGRALGSEAQVIGLMSLDCVHGCKVELHPVFAMAIHMEGFPVVSPDGTVDDQWAFVARNWGNEGWCSHDQHFLDRTSITFVLPGPNGATKVEAVIGGDSPTGFSGTSNGNGTVSGLSVVKPVLIAGQGARVTLNLGEPEKRTQIDGLLHLKWTAPPGTVVAGNASPAPVYPNKDGVEQKEAAEAQYQDTSDKGRTKDIQLSPDAPPLSNPSAVSLVEPDDPTTRASYIPSASSGTIEANRANKINTARLRRWCKQQTAIGIHPDVCKANDEPGIGKVPLKR